MKKTTTEGSRNGIQWTLWSQLGDDFVDDIALLSHTHHEMQKKIRSLTATSIQLGLHIHKEKLKL